MALITADFYSRELRMSTLLTVIVPDSVRIRQKPLSKRQCLYMLHGLSDDSTSIMRLSRVELFAQETGIVIVFPSVGRSMYCDNVNGQNYFTFVADELPEYLELILGLSRKREDNFIAGISMGGMGAARIALTYPERFSAVGLFSGFLDLKPSDQGVTEEQERDFPFLLAERDRIDTTSLNPINLLDSEKHKDLEIIVRCGFQDEYYPLNVAFYKKANALGLNVSGIFEEGAHEWRLWDRYLEDFITMIADK